MHLDAQNMFSDAQAVTTTAISTNVIDLGPTTDNTTRDVGTGEPLYLVITVDTPPTSGGAATAQFTLASGDTASIATNGTASVHFQTKAFTIAEMTAGAVLAAVALPIEGVAYKRYLGILQTTATAAFTGGKINAFLTHDVAKYKAYADAI